MFISESTTNKINIFSMAFVKSYCFYFSCRLGAIIVGVFNIIQILVWLGIFFYHLTHSKELSDYLEEQLEDEELDLSDISNLLTNIKNDPKKYLNCCIAFFSIFALSCIGMMYGVFKLKSYIVYPFVVIDFFYITTLLVMYVMALLILKTNDHGLGPLILYSILGEFIFLYKYYTWFVVVSYCQILHELKGQPPSFSTLAQKNENLLMYSNKPPAYPGLYPKKY